MSTGQRRARAQERGLQFAAQPLLSPILKTVARMGSMVSLPRIGHIISDPALASEVLGAPERFTKTGEGAFSHTLTDVIGPSALINMDGDPHRQLRQRLQHLFTPRFIDQLLTREMGPPLHNAAATLKAGNTLDLVHFAKLFTGRVACALLGMALPPGREDETCLKLFRSGQEFLAALSLASRKHDSSRTAVLRRRFEEITADARAAYDAGEATTVPGRLRELGLDFEESRGTVGLLFLAGTETTATSLSRIVNFLIETEQWQLVAARRDLLPAAILEGLRLTTPVPLLTRHVAEDTVLGGKRLRAGDRLIVCLATSLRSRALGATAHDFDLSRKPPPALANLAFGHGPHFCLGAALARRALHEALTMLLDAGPLTITRRRSARRVMLPSYAVLEVRRAATGALQP